MHSARDDFNLDTSISDFNVRINPVSVDVLFEKYEEAGFLYEDKKKRLLPYLDLVKENFRKAQRAGDSLHYHMVYDEPESKRWAAVSIWRTTTNSWNSQHLVGIGGPVGSRNVLLFGQLYRMRVAEDVGIQSWFSPTNKFPMKVFGSIQRELGMAETSVAGFSFINVSPQSNGRGGHGISVAECTGSDRAELLEFVRAQRGNVYAAIEELDQDDLNLEQLDSQYRSVGLSRYRRCYLVSQSGKSTPVAAATAYRGPTGFNFSFLENRCDLILDPQLNDADSASVTEALIAAVTPLYDDFPLGMIPVISDYNSVHPLLQMGGQYIRAYVQSIWLSSAYDAWYRHADKAYRPILRYIDRQDRKSRNSSNPNGGEG